MRAREPMSFCRENVEIVVDVVLSLRVLELQASSQILLRG